MRTVDANIKEIIKRLETLGYSVGVETVFRDWCECGRMKGGERLPAITGKEKNYEGTI